MLGKAALGPMLAHMHDLPRLALSVRQPSAWAIIHGGKDIENRTKGSIRAGRMGLGRICIHAAAGRTEDEFRYIAWRMQENGVICPPPSTLPRGAIIGTVDVVEIVEHSDSPWFGGAAGLRLANPQALDTPIPAKGENGILAGRWPPHWRGCANMSRQTFSKTCPWLSRNRRAGLGRNRPEKVWTTDPFLA